MTRNRNTATGGGFFIALGAIGGVVAGRLIGGQLVLGLLAGTALGALIALAMWWFSRQR